MIDDHTPAESEQTRMDVSVILDAASWRVGTLSTVVRHIIAAFGRLNGEVVVATGDEVDSSSLEEECRAAGVRHISFPGDHWHAKAINNAAAAGTGEYLLILDEDFLLPQNSIASALRHMCDSESDVVQFECRDAQLPPLQSVHDLGSLSANRYLESVPRAQSNRGAAVLLRKSLFMRLRGYDEHPSFDTHLSVDFLTRVSRAGLLLEWLAGSDVAAYHFFGDNCSDVRYHGVESSRLRTSHLEFVANDRTVYRNLTQWSVPRSRRDVLVSVAVSTRNRCDYLEDCIDSVLAQTFQDFELIIVDDGSSDDTREVVESYDDPRIRYAYQPPSGISAGRNRAADMSQGFFTAVHDDDDIMLPDRLEVSLKNIFDEYGASYGSWVNFNNESGDMVLHVIRRGFSPELNAFNGQGPGHATWLLPTEAIRTVRYDEHLSSSVDHNLASRLAWSGLRWKHTERVMFLRRMHPTQVSAVDGGRQKTTAILTRLANRFSTSESGHKLMVQTGGALTNPVIPERDDLFAAFGPYLPDHLVHRTMVLANNVTNKVVALDMYQKVGCMLAETDMKTGKLRLEVGELPGITWKDLVTLRDADILGVQIKATKRPPIDDPQAARSVEAATNIRKAVEHSGTERARQLVRDRLTFHVEVLRKNATASLWLVAHADTLNAEERIALGSASKSFDIRSSGDHGARFGIWAFGFEKSTDALPCLSRLGDALDSGRLFIVDVERHPGSYIAELYRNAMATEGNKS